MRNHSFPMLVLLLVVGVFGVTDGVKSVSVMEGDSVTLLTHLTEIQRGEELQWNFPNDTIIAEIDKEDMSVSGNEGSFKGRLMLEKTTGSLTITNIKTTDSGDYKLQFRNQSWSGNKEVFSVSVDGVFSVDGVKKMSVKKGEPVTLQTRFTDIPAEDVIEWMFGPQDTDLVRTDRQNKILRYNEDDERFKDRLQLNTKSGDLTVNYFNTEVSGQYKVKIIKRTHTLQKIFNVTVYGVFGVDTDGVKSVSVMEGDSVTLLTDLTEKQTDGDLQWKFPNGTKIAQIDREINTISVPGNKSFEGRLKLNKTTGSLTITNIKTTDSGVYQLKISGKNEVTVKEFSVSVHERSGSTAVVVSVIFGIIALVACAAAVYYWKKNRQLRQMYANAGQGADSML